MGFPFCHRTPALHELHIALPSAIAAPHTGQRCSIARTSIPKRCEINFVTKSPHHVSVLTRINLVAGRGIGTSPNDGGSRSAAKSLYSKNPYHQRVRYTALLCVIRVLGVSYQKTGSLSAVTQVQTPESVSIDFPQRDRPSQPSGCESWKGALIAVVDIC